jgi:hypothetical protein
MINEQVRMFKWSGPNLRHYPEIRLYVLRKCTKNLGNNSRSQDQDLNLGPLEYEARVLITQSRGWV